MTGVRPLKLIRFDRRTRLWAGTGNFRALEREFERMAAKEAGRSAPVRLAVSETYIRQFADGSAAKLFSDVQGKERCDVYLHESGIGGT
jgi:hypothetical protein